MLTTRTVLVLGAGASVPYKFPTGTQLSEHIIQNLGVGSHGYNVLTRDRFFEIGEVVGFRDEFHGSGRNSIDAFLEYRPDYLKVGKAAIAASLLPYENHGIVFNYEAHNWLRYMFNQIASTFEQFGTNALSIVTFNYDRVVEYFLHSSLQHSYSKSDEECVAMMKNIPIIHLHGRLGYLPWERTEGSLPFSSEVTPQSLSVAIQQLKIIHEELEDGRNEEFTMAKQLLTDAEKVYFMGFGFNGTNIKRLDLLGLTPGKSIATGVGLNGKERGAIVTSCGGRIQFCGEDCIGLCREFINWN